MKYLLYISSVERCIIKYERKSLWSEYELINAEVIESSSPDLLGFKSKNIDVHCGATLIDFKDEESARLAYEVYEE